MQLLRPPTSQGRHLIARSSSSPSPRRLSSGLAVVHSPVATTGYLPKTCQKQVCEERFAEGIDGGVEVPFTRWELEEVWDPNPDALGKMQLRCHGKELSGILAVVYAKLCNVDAVTASTQKLSPSSQQGSTSAVHSSCKGSEESNAQC